MSSLRSVPAAVALASALLATACAGSGRSSTPGVGADGSGVAARTTPAPATSPPATTVVPAAWATYHHDAGRSGVDPSEPPATALAPAWTSGPLDGAVYGEPLVVGERVIAATENDSVYALAATTGAVLWSAKLGTPMAGSALPCGDIDPTGITGTPVVDPAAGLVWVVAFVTPGRHDLVALDLTSGLVRSRRPADPPGANPLVEQERGALALAAGTVYVPYGGLYGDCGPYHGFVVGLSATGAGPVASWQVPTTREGGVWAPPGPVVGPGGQLYVTTGNTQSASTFDDGNAVVRLSADLRQQDVFAPADWVALNNSDNDLGSVSPTLLPGGLVFQIGKAGVGYLLRAARLGGVGGQLFAASVCDGAFGGTAVAGNRVFVPCRDGLVALDVGQGPRFSVAWRTHGAAAGAPVVAGGVVWMVDTGGRLLGLDQSTGRVRDSVDLGPVTHFPSLAVGGRQLFAATGTRIVSYRGV
jgi:polyvinyl alcohol dehydrogenase (cytochrome)